MTVFCSGGFAFMEAFLELNLKWYLCNLPVFEVKKKSLHPTHFNHFIFLFLPFCSCFIAVFECYRCVPPSSNLNNLHLPNLSCDVMSPRWVVIFVILHCTFLRWCVFLETGCIIKTTVGSLDSYQWKEFSFIWLFLVTVNEVDIGHFLAYMIFIKLCFDV